jgi:hypothetical protein
VRLELGAEEHRQLRTLAAEFDVTYAEIIARALAALPQQLEHESDEP